MTVTSLLCLKLVDFEIGHTNSFLFLKADAYVGNFIICCRIDIIYNMYDTCWLRMKPQL